MAEPPPITAARQALLASLDSAAATLPDDPWVAGQRVRYLVEAGRTDEALAVARACGGGWWCASLAGLALHAGERYAAADSAFGEALELMPHELRCEWLDLSTVTDPSWHRRLGGDRCRAHAARARELWTLGQPLWMLPGNDLRTEHHARHTMALALEHAANAHAMTFGKDSRELLLRYGWAEWFTREDNPMGQAGFAVAGHDREPSFHFFPARPPGRWLAADTWRFTDTLARSRHAPRRVKLLAPLPHQLARFPRGDSTLIGAAIALPGAMRGERVRTALVVHDTAPRVIARAGMRLAGSMGADTVVVGVEAYADSSRRAARARYSVAPLACGRWCLSDMLLVAADSVEPRTLDGWLARALVEPRVRPGESFGAYFEVQGPAGAPAPARASFQLTVTPVGTTALRRVAAALRLASRLDPVRLRWTGVLEPRDRVAPQYVGMRLPASARGRYRVQLTVSPDGHPGLTATRDIEVAR